MARAGRRAVRLGLVACVLLLGAAGPAVGQGSTPAATAGAAGIGDPYFPTLGNGGYDVVHYDLALAIDVERGAINEGLATIAATAERGLTSFNLDFRGPPISRVTVNDEEADYVRRGGELVVSPAAVIAAGETFSVAVAYRGTPRPTDDPYSAGWWPLGTSVFVAGEPAGAEVWYPVNGHPADKASYRFELTVPKPYEVVANGTLAEIRARGEARTFVWDAPDPMASYLVTLHAAELDFVDSTGPGGLPILHAFPPWLPAAERREFERVPALIAFFEERFGPYPFASFGGTVVPEVTLNAALETQTMVIYDRRAVSEATIAHEIAHQWFGNSVGLERWQDIWLNEGFARYAEYLWLEETEGRAASEQALRRLYPGQAIAVVPGRAPLLIGDPGPDRLFAGQIYSRGALTLHALRLKVGDDTFFAILQSWAARYRHATATTDDFVAVAEEVSGAPLAPFFEAWLYGAGYPPLG